MSTASRVIEMQRAFAERRRLELIRALDFRKHNDDLRAAYHLGVADGHNNVIKELGLLLDTTSVNY